MTVLQFFRNGRSVSAGLEVSLHWSGALSGFSKYRTDASGRIYVEDERISGRERKTDNIYIENPDGGYSLKYPNYVITKGIEHELHIEQATRQ